MKLEHAQHDHAQDEVDAADERFRAEHGHRPLKVLQRVHIKSIIGGKANTPEAANNLLKVLRVVLGHGVEIGMIAHNPAIGINRYRSLNPEGRHAWTEQEIGQYQAHHSIGTRARLALALLASTGQRRSDVVRMGWQHVKGNRISVRQKKTNRPLLIPMHPELIQVLASVPKDNLTFLMTEHGAPFSAAGFGNWFRRCVTRPDCRDAQLMVYAMRSGGGWPRRVAASMRSPRSWDCY